MVAPAWGTFEKPVTERKELNQEYAQESPGQIKDQKLPEGEKPQWGNFQTPTTFQGDPDPTADESTMDWLTRNRIANSSRIAEVVVGGLGNTEKFAKDLLVSMPMSGGVVGWAVSKLMGPERWKQLVEGSPNRRNQVFPTSEELKDLSYKLSEGYTKPKTKGEAAFHEFSEDVGSLLTARSPGRVPGSSNARHLFQTSMNKLLIPATANVTKQVVKELGFSEKDANLAKSAIWLPLTLYNNVNAPAYASDLMNQGRQGVPQNVHVDAARLMRNLDAVEATLHTSDPRTALARQVLSGLRNDVANGQTSVRSAMTMYDGVNAAKRNRGLFDLSRGDQTYARNSINRVRNVLRDEILNSGAAYPDALESWMDGVQAWATIHQSNVIRNNVERMAKGPYAKMLSGPAAALFGVGSYGAAKAPFVSGVSGAIASSAYKTGQTLYRAVNNRTLADYYWRAIGGALDENASVFFKNYNKLNQELKKSNSIDENNER